MAANTYDAVTIGGGHNGLVAAAYLSKIGARVVVLEAREKTGGAADTSSPFAGLPHVRVTTLSYVMSLMPPSLVRDLRLGFFGYTVHPMGPRTRRSSTPARCGYPRTKKSCESGSDDSPRRTRTRWAAGRSGSLGAPISSDRS